MATRYATKTGNWSDVTVWDGGVSKPGVGDIVVANTFTVTIDENVTVTQIQTAAAGGGAAGGGFICSISCTITANILSGSVICLVWSGAAITNLLIVGNVTGTTTFAMQILGKGPVEILGSVVGVRNSIADSTLTITGNVSSNASVSGISLDNSCNLTCVIIGNLSSPVGGSYAYWGNGGGSLTIIGNITVLGSYIRWPSGGSVLRITGNVTANGSYPAILADGTGGTVCVRGQLISGGTYVINSNGPVQLESDQITNATTGIVAVYAPKIFFWNEPNYKVSWAKSTGPMESSPCIASGLLATMWGSQCPGNGGGQALVANVRQGTIYGPAAELTGTCAVPPPNSVLYGVPVDDATGTAAITQESMQEVMVPIFTEVITTELEKKWVAKENIVNPIYVKEGTRNYIGYGSQSGTYKCQISRRLKCVNDAYVPIITCNNNI